jgi:hypothetical protein
MRGTKRLPCLTNFHAMLARLHLSCRVACAVALVTLVSGCLNVRTEPIEVKPIHITVDVNVRVERALEDFFGDLDAKSATLQHPAQTENKR